MKSHEQKHGRIVMVVVILITFLLSVTCVSATGTWWIQKGSYEMYSIFNWGIPNHISALYRPAVSVISSENGKLTPSPAKMTANAGTTPQSTYINTAFSKALAVTVRDASNYPVAGVNVRFYNSPSGVIGIFNNNSNVITVTTDASGIAEAPIRANGAVGIYYVIAESDGLETVFFVLTNRPPPAQTPTPTPTPTPTLGPATMTANVGTTPQSAPVNTAFSNSLAVTARDASNYPVAGVNVTFTASPSGVSGIFSNNSNIITVTTDTSGIAAAPITANGSVGVYNATADASGLAEVVFSLTNLPAATPTPTPPPPPPPPPPAQTFTCDYYASPTGSPVGNGSINGPWDLATALNKKTLVVAGKTLCLRGGTYTGKFKSSLNGGTVRSYPGEWAVIDGNQTATVAGAINSSQSNIVLASVTGISNGKFAIDGEMMQIDHITGNTVFVNRHWDGTAAVPHADGATVMVAGDQLEIDGDNTVYSDFEVMNSDTNRNDNGDANGFDTIIRGSGIVQYNNTGNSYINLIVHDNLNGFFIGSGSSNSLFYGCLSYNNGMYGDPSGHGYYLENSAGYSRVYESMALNNFNLGIQAYGVSGSYVGGDFQGSVFAGSGSPVGQYHYNMIYGPHGEQSPTATVNACHFYHAAAGPSYSILFGYGSGINTGVFTNNYIVGAGSQLMIGRLANATITGNKFYTALSGFKQTVVLPGGTAYNWNNNSYYGTGSFGIGGNMVGFAAWKAATGYDAAGTDTASALPDTVIVRPNAYQAGRANIIIYAGSGAASVNVNLSTSGLVNGQAYTIKNAYNYSGANVATGVYNAASPTISVPLNGSATAVATPTGQQSTAATTCPQQCLLIVVPN